MKQSTQIRVTHAIDQALSEHVTMLVGEIFAGQITVEDFSRDLNIAVGIHENLIVQFAPNQEIQNAVQGRDRADRPQDVSATHEAKTVWEGGWEGVPQHGGD